MGVVRSEERREALAERNGNVERKLRDDEDDNRSGNGLWQFRQAIRGREAEEGNQLPGGAAINDDGMKMGRQGQENVDAKGEA
jgi:hypothetical protein